MLTGVDAEFIVEGVMPNLIHVVPVGDDASLDRVLEGQDPPLALGLISDVRILQNDLQLSINKKIMNPLPKFLVKTKKT